MQSSSPAGLRLRYIFAVLLYGTIGYTLRFISFSPAFVVLCRSVLGTLFILALMRFQRRRLNWASIRSHAGWLLLSGVCLGLNWVCLFSAYVTTSVAVASLFNYTAPIIFLLLCPLLYHTRLTWSKWVCVALAAVGIVLVSGLLEGGNTTATPLGMGLASVAALGFVTVLICNRRLQDMPALDKVAAQLAISAAVVLPFVLITEWGRPFQADLQSVLLTLMLGILHTGLAYMFYFNAIGALPVHTVALLGYLEPVVSVLMSALLLGEPLTTQGIIGAVLIIGAAAASELIPDPEERAST